MTAEHPYAADLELAMAIADRVDALTLSGSQGELTVEMKPDDTPVTAIDRAAERLVREVLGVERPHDVIVGEEYGTHVPEDASSRRWVIDPIDGTKNFMRGVPAWATLVGLLDGDRAVVGVASAPALGRRWFAAAGQGAWMVTSIHGMPTEPRRLQVSDVDAVDRATVSYSERSEWATAGLGERFDALAGSALRTRAFGDFWSYVLVAEGGVDIALEPALGLHDMVALVPIVTEAGGRFTGTDGADGPFSGSGVATNGLLHDAVLDALGTRA